MRILQNVYRNLLLLFLLICAPLCVYSDDYLNYFDCLNSKSELGGVINENSLSKSSTKACMRHSKACKNRTKLCYYLYVADFIKSFIEISTSNVAVDSSTINSEYLAGRAALYNVRDEKVGTCSASFLCMQNADGIYTDISNYLSVDNGLVISWFTPTTLINLEVDSLVHSMVTECLVVASTKVGFNPFYGKTFNMIVSSDGGKIYFKLCEL